VAKNERESNTNTKERTQKRKKHIFLIFHHQNRQPNHHQQKSTKPTGQGVSFFLLLEAGSID
jgi:hypothetical protein